MKNWIVAATIVRHQTPATAPELAHEVGGCLDPVMDRIMREAPIEGNVGV